MTELNDAFEIAAVDDGDMGAILGDPKQAISGIVIFDVSEQSQRLCKVARNERFSNPAVPIAIVGNESRTYPLPFGSRRFDNTNINEITHYLQHDIDIRTLIVEDDEAIREVTLLALSKYMNVETAADGMRRIQEFKIKTTILLCWT